MAQIDDLIAHFGGTTSQGQKKSPAVATSAPRTAAAPVSLPKDFNLDAEAKKAAEAAGVDYALFRGLIKQESTDKHDIVSPAGAYGYTQLMPETAKEMGVDRYDPIQNLQGGAKYLKQQLDRFGDVEHAVAAYNAGPGAVQKYGGIPPFKETQGYVPRVLKYADGFRKAGAPQSDTQPNTTNKEIDSLITYFKENNETPTAPEAVASVPAPVETQEPKQASVAGSDPIGAGLSAVQGAAQGIGIPNMSAPAEYITNALGLTNKPVDLTYNIANTMQKASEIPALQKANELIRSVFGDNRTFQEVAAKAQPQVAQSVEQHPVANVVGNVASGFVPGNPLAMAGEALAAPVIKAVGTGIKAGGKAVANTLLKEPLNSSVGATVAGMTPSLTKGGIAKAAQKSIDKGIEQVQNVLKANPDKVINLKSVVQDPELIKMAVKFDNAAETAAAKKMMQKLSNWELKGTMSVQDAHEMRQTMWELAKFNKQGASGSGPLAKFHEAIGHKVKDALVKQLGPEYAEGLLAQSSNIPVVKAVESAQKAGGSTFQALKRIGAASLTGGASELLQNAPTATAIASGLNAAGKGIQAVSPEVAKILGVLFPRVDNTKK